MVMGFIPDWVPVAVLTGFWAVAGVFAIRSLLRSI